MTQEQDNRPSEAVALLPCPFCGSDVVYEARDTVICNICGATGPDEQARSAGVPADLWNTRAHPSPAPTSDEAAVEAVAKAIEREFNADEAEYSDPDDWPAWMPEARAAITAYKLACPVEPVVEALRECHEVMHECTAVLTASDCAKVAETMAKARTALANWTAGGGDGQR